MIMDWWLLPQKPAFDHGICGCRYAESCVGKSNSHRVFLLVVFVLGLYN